MSVFQLFSFSHYPPLNSLHHAKHQRIPVGGRRHRVFLAVLSAGMFFLFIVLPLWLLHKRSYAPPMPESFGPPSAPAAPAPAEPAPANEEEPVRFK
jgi:hypothetical protein